MKKYILLIIIISTFFIIDKVQAKEITVKLKTCIDGDTAIFTYKNENIKTRFLAIDTPETKYSAKGEQPYGAEASEYTCKRLKEANNIKLEYDNNSDEVDDYGRHLVWVWVDNILLQEELVKEGYAKVAYLYNDYKYTNKLLNKEKIAKNNKLKIWNNNVRSNNSNSNINNNKSENNSYNNILLIFGILLITIILIIKKLIKN